jgi:hypothetical protein
LCRGVCKANPTSIQQRQKGLAGRELSEQ